MYVQIFKKKERVSLAQFFNACHDTLNLDQNVLYVIASLGKKNVLNVKLTLSPLTSASLLTSMLETKIPVPYSLPPRTVKPYNGVDTSGSASMRLELGRTKRIMRILLFI